MLFQINWKVLQQPSQIPGLCNPPLGGQSGMMRVIELGCMAGLEVEAGQAVG